MEKNLERGEALRKLKELAEDIKFCMFATSDANHYLYGRPMTTMQVEDNGTIWFFTSDRSKVAGDARGSEPVCLNYASPAKNNYLTVQGQVTLVKDKKKMEELWSPMLKAWFPDGLDSPDIALLRVEPEQAHYWDADASRVEVLFAMIKGAVTGKPDDTGDHGELKIK